MNVQRDEMVGMYRLKVFKGILCFILFFNSVIGEGCDPSDLDHSKCPPNQLCNEKTHKCECNPGFTLRNEGCVEVNPPDPQPKTPNSSGLVASHNSGSIVAGILIPLFLILFVIYAVYVSRKYNLVTWFRRKMHQRNNNYDEFMIGQDPEDDDPPLH